MTKKKCKCCDDKRYLVSTRSDGFKVIERCDMCCDVDSFFDEDAAILATQDGISCKHTYPCFLT